MSKTIRETSIALIIAVGILMGLGLASCGSGGGGGDGGGGKNKNGLLNGEYVAHLMEHEGSNYYVRRHIINATGDGNILADGGTPMTYTVSSSRLLTLNPGGGAELEYGKVSENGNIIFINDAVDDGDVEMAVGVRNSTGLTLADLAGEYYILLAGVESGTTFYTSRLTAIINSNGTGQWTILEHSEGASGSGPLTAAVLGGGGFSLDNGNGVDYGIMDAGGDVFVVTDADIADGDSETVLAIGIRKSTSTPDITGNYHLGQVALTNVTGPDVFYVSRVTLDFTPTEMSYNVTAHSMGFTGSGGPIPYTGSSDGSATFGPSTLHGQASPDGSVIAISGADMDAEHEIILGVGLE